MDAAKIVAFLYQKLLSISVTIENMSPMLNTTTQYINTGDHHVIVIRDIRVGIHSCESLS